MDDRIKTIVEMPGEISDRVIPAGTKGNVIECYENSEGYAVDVAIPDKTESSGYSYDNLYLLPDQFLVVNE